MPYRFVLPFTVAALALAAALPAPAATILEKSIDVEIQPDGGRTERTLLRVRIDEPADLAAWSPYAVYFDEQRTIESLAAFTTAPGGRAIRLPEGEIGTVDLANEGAFRSSSRARTIRFPAMPPGSILTIETTVRQRSEFRADGISLASDKAPIERLRLTVRGGGRGWRWRLAGPREGLTAEDLTGGVVVTGSRLASPKKERFAPGDRSRGPVLRFAWGEEATWSQVGSWYEGLLASLPTDSEAVSRAARELTAGREDRRERLAAVLDFVRRQVLYVAVEQTIDGHRPSPPGEVLARKWGDCKDKALLLVALLKAAGLEAYPALVHLGSDGRIDAEFPSPFQFNHVIVAVAAQGIAAPGDPVAGGLLFVDPTQSDGAIRWLHPAVQDQDALVVRGAGSALVRTPIRQELEGGRIDTRLTLDAEGGARGETSFEISGDAGAAFAAGFAGARPQEVEQAVREVFGQLLPEAELSQVRWTFAAADVPAVTLAARVRLAALVNLSGAARSLGLPRMAGTPGPELLAHRESPVVLTPKSNRFTWHLEIPEGWCAPAAETIEVGNAVGMFRQSVSIQGRTVEIGRQLEIRQRWIEPARFADLEALSVADHREDQRRLRLDCGAGAVAASR
jgi:transglutaminase-like putative cysteine protease